MATAMAKATPLGSQFLEKNNINFTISRHNEVTDVSRQNLKCPLRKQLTLALTLVNRCRSHTLVSVIAITFYKSMEFKTFVCHD